MLKTSFKKNLKNQITYPLPPSLGILKFIISLVFILDLPYVTYHTSYSMYSLWKFLAFHNFVIKSYVYSVEMSIAQSIFSCTIGNFMKQFLRIMIKSLITAKENTPKT